MWWQPLLACPWCRSMTERAAMIRNGLDVVALLAVVVGFAFVVFAVVKVLLSGSRNGR